MKRSTFIERTLTDINRTMERSVFAEEIAHQEGLLQRLDPRAKLVSGLLLLIAVASARQLWISAALLSLSLLLAVFSRISILTLINRVLLLVVLFTGLIALPALFTTPGVPLWTLSGHLVVTRSGAVSAAFLLVRVTTSISLATIIILSTPWNDVLKALGILRLPDVIVLVLAMTYRYIHLLLHLTDDMFTARKSRLLRRLPYRRERELLGATGGVLLGKSLQLSGEVYLAMQSRGYHHYPRTREEFDFRWYDGLAFLFSSLIMVLVFILK